jgi:hypothetical protein
MEGNEPCDRSQQFHAAVQYLIWALEEIEMFGHPGAAVHARMALNKLRHAEQMRSLSEAQTTT